MQSRTIRRHGVWGTLLFLISCSSGDRTMFLDHAASTPISEKALEEFDRVSRLNGNSSGFNHHGKVLREIEDQSARIIAQKINAKPDQIVFTNNATMANNMAVLGVARNHPGCHMITSKIEHRGLLDVFQHLESLGHRITYLDVDRFGNVDLKQLSGSIGKNTKLISIQTFNSEIGTMQNMKALGEIAKKHGIPLHSDASQSFGKYDTDVDALNIDFLTISGYKIGAPKGIAALYVRDRSKLRPILFGSGDLFFPGTKPTALVASFAAAVKDFRFDRARIDKNFRTLATELLKINDVHINSVSPSHVLSVSIGGVLLEDLLELTKEYSFSAGCSCLGQEKSNVMQAIDPRGKLPSCTIRISFSDRTKPDDLIAFAKNLRRAVDYLRTTKSIGDGCQSDGRPNDLNASLKKIHDMLNSTAFQK